VPRAPQPDVRETPRETYERRRLEKVVDTYIEKYRPYSGIGDLGGGGGDGGGY
jgi:hypothetical protein